MEISLGKKVEEVFVKLDLLQLQSITLPKQFDVAIQLAETTRQQILKIDFDKQGAAVEADNRRARVHVEAKVYLIQVHLISI